MAPDRLTVLCSRNKDITIGSLPSTRHLNSSPVISLTFSLTFIHNDISISPIRMVIRMIRVLNWADGKGSEVTPALMSSIRQEDQ